MLQGNPWLFDWLFDIGAFSQSEAFFMLFLAFYGYFMVFFMYFYGVRFLGKLFSRILGSIHEDKPENQLLVLAPFFTFLACIIIFTAYFGIWEVPSFLRDVLTNGFSDSEQITLAGIIADLFLVSLVWNEILFLLVGVFGIAWQYTYSQSAPIIIHGSEVPYSANRSLKYIVPAMSALLQFLFSLKSIMPNWLVLIYDVLLIIYSLFVVVQGIGGIGRVIIVEKKSILSGIGGLVFSLSSITLLSMNHAVVSIYGNSQVFEPLGYAVPLVAYIVLWLRKKAIARNIHNDANLRKLSQAIFKLFFPLVFLATTLVVLLMVPSLSLGLQASILLAFVVSVIMLMIKTGEKIFNQAAVEKSGSTILMWLVLAEFFFAGYLLMLLVHLLTTKSFQNEPEFGVGVILLLFILLLGAICSERSLGTAGK